MSARLEKALALARAGFAVFPIAPGRKKPPLVPFKDRATRDAERVTEMWNRHPEANIGIHCEGLMVVDIDPAKGGAESYQLLRDMGLLPPTYSVSTPTGGMHLYYRLPAGSKVPNTVGKIADGVDIRSYGGYVVAEGSRTSVGAYTALDGVRSTTAWANPVLVQQAQRPPEAEPKKAESDISDVEAAMREAQRWLGHAPPAIEGQGGDNRTFQVICRVRDIGVPEDRAAEVLEPWNQKCQPPWDGEALAQKIRNAYTYGQNDIGVIAVENLFDTFDPLPPKPEPEPVVRKDPAQYSPADVELSDILHNPYLIKGWIHRETQVVMFGQWNSGKTFVALDMAAHVSAGVNWFGATVRQAGTLYFGYEGEIALRRRVYAIKQEHPDWDMSRFHLRPLRYALINPRGGDERTRGQDDLERAVMAYKGQHGAYPGLIVIDPLRNALGGSDSDPTLTVPLLNYCTRIAAKTGAAVMLVHHPGHGDKERTRGDSGIEGTADTILRVDGERGVIETRKQRDEPARSLHYRLKVVTLGADQDGDPVTTCVVEMITESPVDPALPNAAAQVYNTLRAMVGESGTLSKTMFNAVTSSLGREAAAEIWHTLLKKGYLVADGKSWRLGIGPAEMFSNEEEDHEDHDA